MDWEIEIVRWANSWAGINEFYDWAILFRAEYLGWVVGALAVLIFMWPPRASLIRANWRIVSEIFISGIAARFGVTEIIRFFYDRPRPFEVLEGVRQLVEHSPGGSFPSGHAAFFFALATGVFFYKKWWGILFYVLALSISFGRVAAGLHWPTDILGGAIVGILSAWLVNAILRKLK